MVIWVEAKNPALYSGGISLWLKSILNILVREYGEEVVLVGPNSDKTKVKFGIEAKTLRVLWFQRLPRKLNHLLYDYLAFRFLAYICKPNSIFSPYFDVAFPKSIPSIVTVHDLCFLEVPELYPSLQVKYYSRALKRSLSNAKYVLTVSESTRNAIASRGLFPLNKILVLGNYLEIDFLQHSPAGKELADLRQTFGNSPLLILYTGGYENRKNLSNLIESLRILDEKGLDFCFIITGHFKKEWDSIISEDDLIRKRFHFVGFLDQRRLKNLYLVANVVVYPSLSEGFGRACIESMSAGTPLACSDIPVFREVASDYAVFFNPRDPSEIADSILKAARIGRKNPVHQPNGHSAQEVQDFLRIVRSVSITS